MKKFILSICFALLAGALVGGLTSLLGIDFESWAGVLVIVVTFIAYNAVCVLIDRAKIRRDSDKSEGCDKK